MSPALALALHATAFLATAWAAARVIRWHHRRQAANRINRARDRARLTEQMHLLGHQPRWARRSLADIDQLPTTTRERGNQ